MCVLRRSARELAPELKSLERELTVLAEETGTLMKEFFKRRRTLGSWSPASEDEGGVFAGRHGDAGARATFSPAMDQQAEDSTAWARLMSCTALPQAAAAPVWYMSQPRAPATALRVPVTPPAQCDRGSNSLDHAAADERAHASR